MSAPPAGPCDDTNWFDASLCQAVCDAVHLLSGPADHGLGGPVPCRLLFGGRRVVGMLAHGCHHGEGEHDERDMPVPTVPGAGLVVIKAEFVLGHFKTILDGPALTLDLNQGGDIRAGWTPGREEGQFAISDVAADQKAARPPARIQTAIIGLRIEIGQFAIGPIVEARPLGVIACRQPLPMGGRQLPCDLLGGANPCGFLVPETEDMIAVDAKHIALASVSQCRFDLGLFRRHYRLPPRRRAR